MNRGCPAEPPIDLCSPRYLRDARTARRSVSSWSTINRLARNLADHFAIRTVLRRHGVKLASVVEPLDDSISGELFENMFASLAQFYSANLAEEVKKGMRQKVLQGGWPHNPPRGYFAVPGRIVPDKAVALKIQMAFERCARGFDTWHAFSRSLSDIGLLTQDGRPLAISALTTLLRNPFYAGQLRWKGELFAGRHEPLVSLELFQRVQHVLATRTPRRASSKHLFLMRGLATCGQCGSKMTAEAHGRFAYYRCLRRSAPANACRARYCSVANAHQGLERIYRRLAVSSDVRRLLGFRLQKGFPLQSGIAAAVVDSSRPVVARSIWDIHLRLRLPEQQTLLRVVCSELVLNETGVQSLTFNPPFDQLLVPEQDGRWRLRLDGSTGRSILNLVGRPKSYKFQGRYASPVDP